MGNYRQARVTPLTKFISSILIAAILLAAMPAGFALAGDCDDGTVGNNVIDCIADPIAPDDANIGLGLGDDTFTQDVIVFLDSVTGDGLEDGTPNVGNGGADQITIDGLVFAVIGDGTDGDGGNDTIIISLTGGAFGVGGDGVDGDGGDDVITVDGVVSDVSGDGAGGNGGNDTIVINGLVDFVTGDDVDGNGGDDTIVINGDVLSDVTGDCAPTGDGGNDDITVNGTVDGAVVGDCAGLNGGNDTITISGTGDVFLIFGDDVSGNGGNDVITVNGVVSDVSGDGADGNGGNDTIIINGEADNVNGDDVDGDGGDDLIIINGLVNDDVTGDCTTSGDGGDDHIIVNGEVNGDVVGDCVGGAGGDDTVTIGNGAIVGGDIEGQDGFDTLEFGGITQADLDALGLDPAGGTITIGGQTYTWLSFESLIGLLAEIAERLGLRILFRSNDLLATADADGISVYAEHGRIAFISFATMAELGLGESQTFQTGNAAGWYVSVSNVGAGPNGNSEFQVSIFNPSGTMVGQFSFFN